jgi:hypothetical protein
VKSIKVMADYESYPIWVREDGGLDNVDPRTLPISEGLAQALLDWADAFDATLNRDDPIESGFPTPADEEAFFAQGRELADRLAAELGTEVDYAGA